MGLADALIAAPPILVLDEPTVGLDPVQVRSFRQLILSLAERHTILLSSHSLADVQAVTSRVLVLVGGRLVADGAPDHLVSELGLDAESTLEDAFVHLAERAP